MSNKEAERRALRYLSSVRLRLPRKTIERAVMDAFIAGMRSRACANSEAR